MASVNDAFAKKAKYFHGLHKKFIIKEINEIYQADLNSIRNLATISKKLQKGGLTISGDLNVEGNTDIKGKFNYFIGFT